MEKQKPRKVFAWRRGKRAEFYLKRRAREGPPRRPRPRPRAEGVPHACAGASAADEKGKKIKLTLSSLLPGMFLNIFTWKWRDILFLNISFCWEFFYLKKPSHSYAADTLACVPGLQTAPGHVASARAGDGPHTPSVADEALAGSRAGRAESGGGGSGREGERVTLGRPERLGLHLSGAGAGPASERPLCGLPPSPLTQRLNGHQVSRDFALENV